MKHSQSLEQQRAALGHDEVRRLVLPQELDDLGDRFGIAKVAEERGHEEGIQMLDPSGRELVGIALCEYLRIEQGLAADKLAEDSSRARETVMDRERHACLVFGFEQSLDGPGDRSADKQIARLLFEQTKLRIDAGRNRVPAEKDRAERVNRADPRAVNPPQNA
jgi:hypothetical protein